MFYNKKLNNLWKQPRLDDIEPSKDVKPFTSIYRYDGDDTFSKKYSLGVNVKKYNFKNIEIKSEPLKQYHYDKNKQFIKKEYEIKKYNVKPVKLNDALVPEPVKLKQDENPNYRIYGKLDAKDLMIASLQKDTNFPNKLNKLRDGDEEYKKSFNMFLEQQKEHEEAIKNSKNERNETNQMLKQDAKESNRRRTERIEKEAKEPKKVVIKTEPVKPSIKSEPITEEDEDIIPSFSSKSNPLTSEEIQDLRANLERMDKEYNDAVKKMKEEDEGGEEEEEGGKEEEENPTMAPVIKRVNNINYMDYKDKPFDETIIDDIKKIITNNTICSEFFSQSDNKKINNLLKIIVYHFTDNDLQTTNFNFDTNEIKRITKIIKLNNFFLNERGKEITDFRAFNINQQNRKLKSFFTSSLKRTDFKKVSQSAKTIEESLKNQGK